MLNPFRRPPRCPCGSDRMLLFCASCGRANPDHPDYPPVVRVREFSQDMPTSTVTLAVTGAFGLDARDVLNLAEVPSKGAERYIFGMGRRVLAVDPRHSGPGRWFVVVAYE